MSTLKVFAKRFLQCVIVIYICFIFLFSILFINVRLEHGESTNALDLVLCVATWPAVIIITKALICKGFHSQKNRRIFILSSMSLLVLSVYGTWWVLNRRILDRKFEAVKTAAWAIAKASAVCDMPLTRVTRELSNEGHILCVRGSQEAGPTEIEESIPTGLVLSSKLAKIPRSVKDVAIVVLILQQPISVAHYTDSSALYQWRFNVTVIDWKAHCVIEHCTFDGEISYIPPRKFSNVFEGDRYGKQPWDSVRMWLYQEKAP